MVKNRINKRILYLVAAAIWGIPGLIIAMKGIRAYTAMPAEFTAFFYSGLGPALVVAGCLFLKKYMIQCE